MEVEIDGSKRRPTLGREIRGAGLADIGRRVPVALEDGRRPGALEAQDPAPNVRAKDVGIGRMGMTGP